MNLGHFKSMDAGYRSLVDSVGALGYPYQPRGMDSVEVRPAQFTVSDPRLGLYTGRSRRLNYRFLAIETLSYIAGWGDERHAGLMVDANKNVAKFVNQNTGRFDGAYGPRFKVGIRDAVESLYKDRSSRQAVASVWSPGVPSDSLDVPCTLSLQFYRSGERKLGMVATMRSNDLNWGTPYDVAAFSAIQLAVASCLGLEPGEYHHHAGSLHYYLNTPPEVTLQVSERFEPVVGWPPYQNYHVGLHPVEAWDLLVRGANSVLESAYAVRKGLRRSPWSEVSGGHSSESGWVLMIRNGGREASS